MTLRPFCFLALAVLLLAGCVGSRDGETASDEIHCANEKQILAAQAPPSATVTEAHLYLDTSDTMRGYLSDAAHPIPVTLYQELLQNLLLEKLHAVGLTAPQAWGFGRGASVGLVPLSIPESDGCPGLRDGSEGEGTVPLHAYALCRSFYSATESDIIGALADSARHPGALSVVITDNAQDLLRARANKAPGFDRAAFIRTVVDDLAKKGFGVWLLGFKSDFDGIYFSVQLTLGRHGVRPNQPMQLSSPRPVYCWIVSRDLAKGRQLATALAEELQRLDWGRHPKGETQVHALELAPGILPGLRVQEPTDAELNADTPTATPRDVLRVSNWRGHPESSAIGAADLKFKDPRTQDLLFLLKVGLEAAPSSLAALSLPPSDWKLSPGESLNLGTAVSSDLTGFAAASNASTRFWRMSFPCDRVLATPVADRWVDVPLNLTVDLDALPPWVGQWSTSDDTKAGLVEGKSLYISDVLRGVLAETLASSPKACLHVTLARE